MKTKIILTASLALLLVGCASFYNATQKTIYSTTMLADGAMKSYAVYWKAQTNQAGFIADATAKQAKLATLEAQRSNVMVMSWDVGAGLAVVDRALQTYQGNVGTNTTTKAVVDALLQTAISRAGSFAAYIGTVIGNTNLTQFPNY